MPPKLGVLIVHGMGTQGPEFAEGMIRELDRRIARPGEIIWQAAEWADILSNREDELCRRMSVEGEFGWKDLRQFVIRNFGDAIAYQKVEGGKRNRVYENIHQRVHEHLARLRTALRDGLSDSDKERPLVVMAHSLGAYIMSNYIWDRQHKDPEGYGTNDMEAMRTLAGMVTFGCNIPLFMLAYDEIQCIEFPPRALSDYFPGADPAAVARAARWLNFFDADDVLGYPLKNLSASYQSSVIEDIPMNAGSILYSWNPLSHSHYWTDNDMTKPVAEMLSELLQLLP